MLRILRRLRYRRRAHPRHERSGVLFLFSDTRGIGHADILDASEGGARVRTNVRDLKDVRFVLEPASAQVATVRLAWEGDGTAGFEYLSKFSIRGFVSDPAVAHIQRAWREMAFDYSKVAPGGAFSR